MWSGLRRRVSAVRRVTAFDPSGLRSQVAGEVDAFEPTDFIEARRARRMDRYSQFAVAAARLALEDARLDPDRVDRDRVGVQIGSALGGCGFAEGQTARFLAGGLKAVDVNLPLSVFGGAASCNVAMEFGFTGPNETNSMSCASGTVAIGNGLRLIRSGAADAVLAGGVEAPLYPLCFGAFTLIRAMSSRNHEPDRASRPFDRGRDGFVMSEAGVILVLEEWEAAVRRGARIYAELKGYGISNDAYHMTRPRPDGSQAARAMRLALDDAGVGPDEVGYVNAHGSATPLNDSTEARAICAALGERGARVPVSGTKGYYGHALGASGAIEAAITALSIQRGWLPPTLNCDEPDPECGLSLVRGQGLEQRVDVALSNSFGFGGINACLAFGHVPRGIGADTTELD